MAIPIAFQRIVFQFLRLMITAWWPVLSFHCASQSTSEAVLKAAIS
jgi:hypothetical protein